jgi:hypothetical protein
MPFGFKIAAVNTNPANPAAPNLSLQWHITQTQTQTHT